MKIAVIGSGISGLSAAYLLSGEHEVKLFEKNDYLGGHSRTVDIEVNGQNIAVDSGFIVFNDKNYPNLRALFSLLGVETIQSNMSFGVSIDNGWLEYGTNQLSNLFAQKKNFFRIQYYQMLLDVLKFNRRANQFIQTEQRDQTQYSLGEFLKELKLGEWFKKYYLLAMGSSIWSMSYQDMLNFPAISFIQFFNNHGLLTVNDQPQWHTVKGGSRQYVQKIIQPFKSAIDLSFKIKTVRRKKNHIEIIDQKGASQKFDQVIFACHPNQTLKLLEQASEEEVKTLSLFQTQSNEIILHSDPSFMPKHQSAWSSWVYLSQSRDNSQNLSQLTYWMNLLQSLNSDTPVLLTLNHSRLPREELIHQTHQFEHPIFNQETLNAQKIIPSLQGKNHSYFCGAWMGYGFHEDGLLSAISLLDYFNQKVPWD